VSSAVQVSGDGGEESSSVLDSEVEELELDGLAGVLTGANPVL
jgi:hypothetical protein